MKTYIPLIIVGALVGAFVLIVALLPSTKHLTIQGAGWAITTK